jgi:hypothetical protein
MPTGLFVAYPFVSSAGSVTILLGNAHTSAVASGNLVFNIECTAGGNTESASGPVNGSKGSFATVDTVIGPHTTVALAAVTLAGAKVGDLLRVSPRSTLPGSLGLAYARVSAADTVVLALVNPAASGNTSSGALTWDYELLRGATTSDDPEATSGVVQRIKTAWTVTGGPYVTDAQGAANVDVPVTGAAVNDVATVSRRDGSGLGYCEARVVSANLVRVRTLNPTASPVSLVNGTVLDVTVQKS